jgi:hypothetical protein
MAGVSVSRQILPGLPGVTRQAPDPVDSEKDSPPARPPAEEQKDRGGG